MLPDISHKPEEFEQEGEEFLTNAIIRPDEPKTGTKAKTEAYYTKRYRNYDLRFQYENLVLGGHIVTSAQFGDQTTDLLPGRAIGVAIYGKKKAK